MTLNSGQSAHVALARLAGTTDNSLDPPASAVLEYEAGVPASFSLTQNYPNPFNPVTTISYQLPVAGTIRLAVYDMLGREVCVLLNERKEPGGYTATWDAGGMASGMYLYRLVAGDYHAVRKMLVLR